MREKIIEVIPADSRPESIEQLSSILEIDRNKGLSIAGTKKYNFDGTVEEKLQQYREYFGKEWPGFPENTITKVIIPDMETIGLGQQSKEDETLTKKIRRAAQKKIDKLVEEARDILKWNEKEKTKKASKTTRNKPTEVLL